MIQKFICYCAVFTLFYFVFERNFQVADLKEVLFALRVIGGLIFGGAYFRKFTCLFYYVEEKALVANNVFAFYSAFAKISAPRTSLFIKARLNLVTHPLFAN